ncbi:MAG TPA: DsbA family oxidoreductase, partial [Herpetosiphonaceae bacterium]
MQIEIWSDLVCPWCYIGKRRFEAALAGFAHRDAVSVRWRSFELEPDAPRQTSEPLVESLAERKRMPVAQAQAMIEQVTGVAAADGLAYRLDLAQSGNTFDAHRLVHLAAERGLGEAVTERLMRGYFSEGAAIGEREPLASLAAEAGLEAEAVAGLLDGDAYADAVRGDERLAMELGIQGVPFFVIDGKYGISGAQPAAALREALEQIWAREHPAPVAAGESCDDG